MSIEDYEADDFFREAMVVPDEFKLALADLIINFGRIEVAVDRLISWAADFANPSIARLMTGRIDIQPKCNLAPSVLDDLHDRQPLETFKPLAKKIENVAQFRNSIVHGWWMVFGDSAVSMSPRPRKFMSGAIEGPRFGVSDILKNAQQAKEVEIAILTLLRQPSPTTRRGGLDC